MLGSRNKTLIQGADDMGSKLFVGVCLVCLLLIACDGSPKQCATCTGTGKITQSRQEALPYELVSFEVTDLGVVNPDYIATVKIHNKGDKDGKFKLSIDYLYSSIGQYTVEDEMFIKAHQVAEKEIRYDADNYADNVACRIEAPIAVVSEEVICPTCKGSGVKK